MALQQSTGRGGGPCSCLQGIWGLERPLVTTKSSPTAGMGTAAGEAKCPPGFTLTLQTRATLAWMCLRSHCPPSRAVSRKKT